LKQLAQRSQPFIIRCSSYEGQLTEENPLTGYKFDWKKKSNKIVGFVSYFELINGFKSTLYMTVDEVKKHGEEIKTFGSQYGVWKTEFESMALKTVTKLNLS
jgi:recombination protein RecT